MDQLSALGAANWPRCGRRKTRAARPPWRAWASCRPRSRSTSRRWVPRWKRRITRLLQTASEVPQAAAGVITELRQEMSRVAERDNLALQERSALLEQLGTLLQAVNQASGEQRAAIEALSSPPPRR